MYFKISFSKLNIISKFVINSFQWKLFDSKRVSFKDIEIVLQAPYLHLHGKIMLLLFKVCVNKYL